MTAKSDRGVSPLGQTALTTKAPYLPLGDHSAYEPAPSGYQAVATQMVSRHGSRTLAKPDASSDVLALWRDADDKAALTATGRSLRPALEDFVESTAQQGYGMLTDGGRREIVGIADRMIQRLPGLFGSFRPTGASAAIQVSSASKRRTRASAETFVQRLCSVLPGVAPQISSVRIDDDLLYFHKTDERYQRYVKTDRRLATVRSAARDRQESRTAARELLTHNFAPDFVDRLSARHRSHPFADELDAAAAAVFSVWQIAAGLSAEDGRGLGQLVPPLAASWFGYLDDLDTFYKKAPGFAGEEITYSMAKVLLADMFTHFEEKRTDPHASSAALRFTHAEEILPLACLLRLPGCDQQVPESAVYDYATNPFRGALIAPMGANIQWDLFTDGARYLVRMLHNERETRFAAECRPIGDRSYFYDLDELARFYR